ncbi:MAG: HAMP domain-containing sensor histidine kinase [Pseudohongiellaceae bacterium]
MNAFILRVKHSLFFRLFLIFSITVLLFVVIITVSLRQFNQSSSSEITAIPDFFIRNIESIIDEIGTPPDLETAVLLANDLDWTIHIQNPIMSWKSDEDDRLDVESAVYDRTLASDAEIRTISGEDIIVVIRNDYEFVLYQRYLDSNEFNYVTLYAGVTLAAIVLLLNYLMVNRLLDPIRLLKRGAERIRQGDLSFRVPTDRQDELGELTMSVNHMADSLQSMLEAKRQLLLAISHELRTPITRAKLQLEFMEDGRIAQNLREDIDEIDLLISDLLEAERLNNEHSVLVAEPVQFSGFVESVVEPYFAYPGGLELDLPAQSREMHIDKLRIRLLITNLLNNAIRHGENEPLVVKVSYKEERGVLEVIDHGEGIAAEHLASIGEPFYRADSARQRNTGGFGLGLYLCKLIAQAHGGKLRISSEPGQGTHITVELPNRPPEFKGA